MIVGRRYFDDIHARKIDARECADDRQRLVGRMPTRDRRAGARRKRRVEEVDIEGEISRLIADSLANETSFPAQPASVQATGGAN